MKTLFDLKTLPGWTIDNHTKIAIRLVENENYIAITKPIYKSHSVMDIIEFIKQNDGTVEFNNRNNNNQIAVTIDYDEKKIYIKSA
ncbi:hypothetical protein ROU88_02485 [Macrococcus capreoli]|uniref:hypothetical protein n=1 Tax=Macrococcus capreoli TaxID=2982690 RepID=UPI0021D5F319|nr:hypothetical protein [Macrococcus sp. TMW 2.2395]MCU7556339.1 hypothetical protein [Macrococcus sp. TMW 2.2395]